MIKIRSIYTVGQLNAYIKNMFTQDYFLQALFVRGEVSNCKYHSSGHIYFTLKDGKGTINCVMFAGNRSGLTFRLENGQQVVVGGTVDVYEREGKYQLYAKQVVLDGRGLLYEKYEQLKRQLEEEGLFAKQHKKPIPRFIRTLGVVTADTGAAVRDIIQIATRRNPYVQIILYPAIVQGEMAAGSVAQGIRALEQLGVDVMIVGRGGGSIEDLWAFNERLVAQAVFDCQVPIISAVGHETDTTIIDYVSDLRAPTPSAAAELAVLDIREIDGLLEGYRMELKNRMEYKLQRVRELKLSYDVRINAYCPTARVREKRMYCLRLEERLNEGMQAILQKRKHAFAIYLEKLKGLSPLERLSGGFSYTEDEEGKNIRSVEQVKVGQTIKVQLLDGSICAVTSAVRREER